MTNFGIFEKGLVVFTNIDHARKKEIKYFNFNQIFLGNDALQGVSFNSTKGSSKEFDI